MARMETPVCGFGTPAIEFALRGVDERMWTLSDVCGERATLIMFICNHCPYVKAAIDRIVRDARELATLGVGVAAIMPNDVASYPDDSFENMQRFAREHDLGFPYLIDETQAIARAYGAACTPDYFGYNADLALQFRGRLDAGRKQAPAPDSPRELFDAMRQIAETGQGPREQTPSMGCSIKWR